MAESKVSVPKGTRDFSPAEMLKRNYIFDTIRKTFKLFGFQQIETPAMENLSSLLGKYGDEGDKLLFRILNSGNFLENADPTEPDIVKLSNMICEKGLRYDLTVPFARYVVQHRNEIVFPFKRYQIQPVWRADRPQKGRYREFYQCDADTIGSDSLLNELELIKIVDLVFTDLKIPVKIKINNRKILAGIAEVIKHSDKLTEITIALDKLDKIGKEAVLNQLQKLDINEDTVSKLVPVIEFNGTTNDKITFLGTYLESSLTGQKGIDELKTLFDLISLSGIRNEVALDLTLARGLNYYTGAIIEVAAKGISIGSICGGGRYDNLTGFYGLPGVSGVGISFGADRIFDVLEQMDLFPSATMSQTKLLFINFGDKEVAGILPMLNSLRQAGISTILYPESDKLKKQMNFANSNNIPFVALVGENEIKSGVVTLKNMQTGDQEQLTIEKLGEKLSQ